VTSSDTFYSFGVSSTGNSLALYDIRLSNKVFFDPVIKESKLFRLEVSFTSSLTVERREIFGYLSIFLNESFLASKE